MWGVALTTITLGTGTASSTTCQKPSAEHENMARPRVVERSMPPRTKSEMRWRSASTDAVAALSWPLEAGHPPPAPAQEVVEMGLHVLGPDVAAAVDVEVTRGHRRPARW